MKLAALLAVLVPPSSAYPLRDVAPVPIHAPGPSGPLGGMLTETDPKGPLLLLIPGSGPTDLDGNNGLGVRGAIFKQLAEQLAQRGVATLRIDKRGMFSSKAAIDDPNAVTIADYAADVHNWVATARSQTGRACIWVAGHSEGALVALQAAQKPAGICGLVLIAGPGRPLGTILREQFRANPANAPLLDQLLSLVDDWEAGKAVSASTMPPPLGNIFPDSVQPYLIDMLRYDPAKLARNVPLPMLIVAGDRDVQVAAGDAQLLAQAAPQATHVRISGMTHVLRIAADDSRAASLATYANASLPISDVLVQQVAEFVSPAPRSAASPAADRP